MGYNNKFCKYGKSKSPFKINGEEEVKAVDAKTGKSIDINKPTREGTASSNAYNIAMRNKRLEDEKNK